MPTPTGGIQPTRRIEIGGNWKLNPDSPEKAKELALDVFDGTFKLFGKYEMPENLGITLFVPSIFLMTVADALESEFHSAGVKHEFVHGSDHIALGAQNMYFESKGAFTGEMSPDMIVNAMKGYRGQPSVLIGHSERRQYFGETDEGVNRKVHAALRASIRPFVCIGETIEERSSGKMEEILARQLSVGLQDVSAKTFFEQRGVIAYEPVWAIGTGETATPEMAQETHAFIRQEPLTRILGAEIADQTSIQYGGSMKPGNAGALLAMSDIDGGLIGGAALNAESFVGIIGGVRTAAMRPM